MRRSIKGMIFLLALAAGLVLGYLQIQPPPLPRGFEEKAVTLAEAAQAPDLNLLLSHIRAMASRPHHVDSEGLRVTQAYLKDQIEALGFAYTEDSYRLTIPQVLEVDRARIAGGGRDFGLTAQQVRDNAAMGERDTLGINNILVKVDAPDTEEAILFVSHTHSVKDGPGAFDDTVSVAAMLEGLRQLSGRTPARDVYFLFTDGEEQGLLGAAQFVADHPDMRQHAVLVINLEARGNRGALLMFETTPDNLGILQAYAGAAGHPVSFSLATAVYRTMRNDTDLSVFMAAGYPGINFAVVQGAEVYHTPQDNVETFDRASAHHYLLTVAGLVEGLAFASELRLTATQDAVFFPLLPGRLVVMPQSLALILAVAAFILTMISLAYHIKRGRARLAAVLRHGLLQLLGLAAAYGLGMIAIPIMDGQSYEDYLAFLRNGTDWLYIGVLLAICCLAGIFAWRRLTAKRQQDLSPALGMLVLPATLALAAAWAFPAASYLLSIPVLLYLLALQLHMRCRLGLLPGLFVLVTLLLFVPVAALIHIALSFRAASITLVLAMLPITMMVGLYALPDKDKLH